jgi:hypothetical protein
MFQRKSSLTALLFATGLVACANGSLADREAPTDVGSSIRGDASDRDLGRTWDAADDAPDSERDIPQRDAAEEPLPPWEEGESCFPADPFGVPVSSFDLASGPGGGEVSVVQTRNGLLIVRAGVSNEEWGIYTAKTDRSAQNVVESSRIASLYPAADPVEVKVDGGFLVAYTVNTEPDRSLWLAVLDEEGVPRGDSALVGEGYSTSVGSTFVVVDGQPILFAVDDRPGQQAYRRIEISATGEIIGDDALDLGEDATDLSVGVSGDQIGLSWLVGPSSARVLRFASLSKAGAVEVDPVQVTAEGAARPTSVQRTGSGWAVVYGTNEGGTIFRVWMLQLDANGVPVGVPREIPQGSTTAVFPRAAWDGEALAVVWQENTGGDIAYTLVGLDGAGTGPSTVSETLEGAPLPTVFWVGDRYAVTWQDWSNDTGYVQRLAVSSVCQ